MRIKGIPLGVPSEARAVLWMTESGYWTEVESEATEFCKVEADRRLRIINANNRFLDRDEQIEAMIVESK